jgi:uncharacterized protein YjiS (DUF1127 family)
MQFSELQEKVLKVFYAYCERHGITPTKEYAAMKLTEELGEYMQSALGADGLLRKEKGTREELHELSAHELADVVALAIVNADIRGLDIEKALTEKWFGEKWNKVTESGTGMV